jgi:hypothetical protein
MFYVLYPFVTYLLTVPRKSLEIVTQIVTSSLEGK